jgi:hypothetical protein
VNVPGQRSQPRTKHWWRQRLESPAFTLNASDASMIRPAAAYYFKTDKSRNYLTSFLATFDQLSILISLKSLGLRLFIIMHAAYTTKIGKANSSINMSYGPTLNPYCLCFHCILSNREVLLLLPLLQRLDRQLMLERISSQSYAPI